MPVILAALVLLLSAGEASAVEHYLVQWKKTQRCEVVVKLPFFGSHYIQLGLYASRWEAERALESRQNRRQCPMPDDDKPAKPPPAG